MKQIVFIILVIAGAVLIYQGVNSFSEIKEILEIGDFELKAQTSDNTQPILYLIIGVLSAIGRMFLLKK